MRSSGSGILAGQGRADQGRAEQGRAEQGWGGWAGAAGLVGVGEAFSCILAAGTLGSACWLERCFRLMKV